MNSIITVENLSKKYSIGHQKQGEYQTFRDSLTHGVRSIYQRLCHPFSPNSEEIDTEEFWALKDINFEVKQGDRIGIIGSNGAGKSTLLKILSRITHPTTGKIHIKGRVTSLLEVGTGFHPELTGRENIFLNGAILGMSRVEIKKKFDEIVEFAGIEKFLDTPVKRYSSGMYVRLAFSVAAHLDSEILLVDEVLAVGDAAFQKKCLGKMNGIAKEGRTILFVSHNMGAIRELCERGIVINNGQNSKKQAVEACISQYISSYSSKERDDLIDRKDRKGNGDVKITKVEVFNADKISEVFSGADVVIRLHYIKNSNKAQNIRFDIGIDNQLGTRIGHLSTYTINEDVTDIINDNASGLIDFQIKNLPLHEGLYHGTICVYANGIVADWVRDAFNFNTLFGDYYNSMKLPPVNQGNMLFNYIIKKNEKC